MQERQFFVSSQPHIQLTLYMKYILATLGLISFGLGVLGMFLPVLPTTPFLLLASVLFLKSSKILYDWLMNHPRFGPYISNFIVYKAIPLRVKIVSVTLVWITLLYCAVMVAEHWAFRALLIAIATAVTVHILSYKTLK